MGRPSKLKEAIQNQTGEPLMTAYASDSTTRTRRNRAGTIERTDKYTNIDSGALPFKYSNDANATMDIREASILCQKAYYNVSIVRNIIDLMTEFSVGNIYYRKGTKASREFFEAFSNKINLKSFQDKYYREYYRSGNDFIFRIDAEIQSSDIKKISQVFGALDTGESKRLPVKYIILNPSDIKFAGNIAFSVGQYFKVLSDYELVRLRIPKTEEDQQAFDALPADVKKAIQSKTTNDVLLPLDPDKIVMIFYKKQDYEPFAVPMIYPVLEDLNFKIELKKLDMAIARTHQQIILLITNGAEPEKGGINQKNLEAFQKLFANESVGRVLVADYTTKAQFVIPDIGSILSPDKYQVVNEDINMGLNNILIGGEKFANQAAKIDVFLARLNHGREVFLNEFWIPEIKRISKELGFKNFPIPYYDDVALKNNDLRDKVYTRLLELGILTPSETITALETNRLPDQEASIESQKEYLIQKEEGLYKPIDTSGKSDEEGNAQGGRPGGSKAPQTTKKVSPIGTKASLFSASKLIEVARASSNLEEEVSSFLKKKFNKKTLTKKQKEVCSEITNIIVANEDIENWTSKIEQYCEKPVDTNPDRIIAIGEICAEHECDQYIGSLLYLSKK
jgi:hypothetical protein